MGYLDNAGLAHLWGKVAEALSGKQDTLAPGDGVSLTGPSISVKIPVHEPVTWSEYNALTLEQKTNGLYFILYESGPEIEGGPEESLPETGEWTPESGEGETVPDEAILDEGGLDEVAPWEVSALRLNGVEILLPYASVEVDWATREDVDAAISAAIDDAIRLRARIETGTYIGTGQSGADHPNSLTFSFPPTIVMFVGARFTGSGVTPDNISSASVPYLENFSDHGFSVIAMTDLLTSYMQYGPAATVDLGTDRSLRAWAKRSTDGRTLTWYTEIRDNNWDLVPDAQNNNYQYNYANKKYRYVAIG